jgi:phage terminase large subunit
MAAQVRIDLPPKLAPLLLEPGRFKVAHGGRDSSKSWSFARTLVALTYARKLRVMCGREIQKSIKDSVHKLLSDQIDNLGLAPWFTVQEQVIKSASGSEILFAGLQELIVRNLKSVEGIDILWVEEAENVSARSWEIIIPTIRKPNSEIWVSFNADLETDPTYQRFIVNPSPNARVVGPLTWRDNPWASEALREDREYLYRVDPQAAAHVWGGECRTNSEAQVLRNKCVVESFEHQAGWDGPYFGCDWGFSQDPTALIRFSINGKKLMVEYEAWGIAWDIDVLAEKFDAVPGAREASRIRADSARPETISYMQRHGYPGMFPAEKWKGSVEDGVAFLRQFEQIVIHPRCVHTFEESRLWSYKKDRLSGDVTTDLIDAHNHCWDAVRYGLEPLTKQAGRGLLEFMRQQAAAVKAPIAQTITHTQTVEGLQFPSRSQ